MKGSRLSSRKCSRQLFHIAFDMGLSLKSFDDIFVAYHPSDIRFAYIVVSRQCKLDGLGFSCSLAKKKKKIHISTYFT